MYLQGDIVLFYGSYSVIGTQFAKCIRNVRAQVWVYILRCETSIAGSVLWPVSKIAHQHAITYK